MVDSAFDAHVDDAAFDAPPDSPRAQCPSSYLPIPGGPPNSRYRFAPSLKEFQLARAECLGEGTDLVVIDDAIERDAVGTWTPAANFWIGIIDSAIEGTWMTVHGATATFLPWATNEPNGGTNENCAIQAGDNAFYSSKCNNTNAYVCECEQ